VGHAAFDSAAAERLAACGDPVILVRPDISTADIAGFRAASGIVTATGGMTAHASLAAAYGKTLRGGLRRPFSGTLGAPGWLRRSGSRRGRLDLR